jgi:hypothetical protein
MSSQYNTINTLNNSENNIFNTNNNLNFKGKNNLNNVAPIKANKKIYYINNNNKNKNKNKNKLSIGNSYNSKTKLYIKNSLIKKKIKNITSQNSKEKKLKNVITSIEYCNNNNKSDNSTKKNVILSEVSSSGKINIRIREMENSIEKVIKENSINITNNMSNNNLDLPSPKKWDNDLTYIKKNQGTLFKKIKKHNTVNHLNRYYYPPPVPSK